MNITARPVDQAMSDDRLEKQAIRAIWIQEIKNHTNVTVTGDIPLYLTLPGAEGKDIQLLIDEGIVTLTEINSISQVDQNKIIAVENNNSAILELQKRFIGLKIIEAPFQNLIRGDQLFSWPNREEETLCRAKIINLDLNSSLKGELRENRIVFQVPLWIQKLCHIHAKPPSLDWTLFLTLHGEVVWNEPENLWIHNFLKENFVRDNEFQVKCKAFWGTDLFNTILNNMEMDYSALDRVSQQKIIMTILPKIIVQYVHNDGWKVETIYNLWYGQGYHAPMVTWIMKFIRGTNPSTPNEIYCSSLKDIFLNVGNVQENGDIYFNP